MHKLQRISLTISLARAQEDAAASLALQNRGSATSDAPHQIGFAVVHRLACPPNISSRRLDSSSPRLKARIRFCRVLKKVKRQFARPGADR
jgi:hypothetical protein